MAGTIQLLGTPFKEGFRQRKSTARRHPGQPKKSRGFLVVGAMNIGCFFNTWNREILETMKPLGFISVEVLKRTSWYQKIGKSPKDGFNQPFETLFVSHQKKPVRFETKKLAVDEAHRTSGYGVPAQFLGDQGWVGKSVFLRGWEFCVFCFPSFYIILKSNFVGLAWRF